MLFYAMLCLRNKTSVPVFYRGNTILVPIIYFRDKTRVHMFYFDSNTRPSYRIQ